MCIRLLPRDSSRHVGILLLFGLTSFISPLHLHSNPQQHRICRHQATFQHPSTHDTMLIGHCYASLLVSSHPHGTLSASVSMTLLPFVSRRLCLFFLFLFLFVVRPSYALPSSSLCVVPLLTDVYGTGFNSIGRRQPYNKERQIASVPARPLWSVNFVFIVGQPKQSLVAPAVTVKPLLFWSCFTSLESSISQHLSL